MDVRSTAELKGSMKLIAEDRVEGDRKITRKMEKTTTIKHTYFRAVHGPNDLFIVYVFIPD